MIAEFRPKKRLALVMWFLFKALAIGFAIAAGHDSPVNTTIFWILFLAGTGFMFRACWASAREKAQPDALMLFALLGIVGYAILGSLEDKSEAVPRRTTGTAPRVS